MPSHIHKKAELPTPPPPPHLLAGIRSSVTHVSDQVQPASSVSKLQAPGKPTESTFIAGDPVTECVIHYFLICLLTPPFPTHPTTSPLQPPGQLHSLIGSVIKHTCGVGLIYQMQGLCLWPVCSKRKNVCIHFLLWASRRHPGRFYLRGQSFLRAWTHGNIFKQAHENGDGHERC